MGAGVLVAVGAAVAGAVAGAGVAGSAVSVASAVGAGKGESKVCKVGFAAGDGVSATVWALAGTKPSYESSRLMMTSRYRDRVRALRCVETIGVRLLAVKERTGEMRGTAIYAGQCTQFS